MVDKLIGEKKRAQEYSVLVTQAIQAIKEKLRNKGLSHDGGEINPLDLDSLTSYNFGMSVNHESGVTTFSVSFAEAFIEKEMTYEFKDGKVRKVGHAYVDGGIMCGERYYGEYTDEEMDFIVGKTDNPEELPRDDISFEAPLSVGLKELRVVSQIINSLAVDPKKADGLVRELPWLE